MYSPSRQRKLRSYEQFLRLAEYREHHQPCAFHLCGERRGTAPLRRRDSRRCRAHAVVSTRPAAAARDDWAQPADFGFAENADQLEKSTLFGGYVVECDFQLSIQHSRSSGGDSVQKTNAVFGGCFVPDRFA